MSYSIQPDMQTTNTTTISDMRMAILKEVSSSVNQTLSPFMEKVKLAESRHNAILEMLQHHPKYMELLEENIILKKQLRSQDSENVKINISDTADTSQVSVSDVYSEFGVVKKENKNLDEKKTVITSLPNAGSAISSKLVDFQKSLEETLVDDHELIDEFKTTFSDFLLAGTESDSDTSSVEEVTPPQITRQTIDLTSSWLSSSTVKQETVNLNDPIQARMALSPGTNTKNVTVKAETVVEDDEEEEEIVYEEDDEEDDDEEDEDEDEEDDEEEDEDEDEEEEDGEKEDGEKEDEEEEDEDEEDEDEDEDEEDEDEDEDEEEDDDEESDKEEKVPVKPRNAVTNQDEDDAGEEEDDSEEELYMMELEDDEGNPLEYYCNDEKEMNGDIFEILPDESVGPKVGIIKDGEIELFE